MSQVALDFVIAAGQPVLAGPVQANLVKLRDAINSGLDSTNLAAAILQALHAPGDLKMSAIAAPPTGWLLCDGSAVSRTGSNAPLFAAIGTTYGVGDGTTTFNLPDFRGRMPVGVGTQANVNALNKNDGVAVANRSPQHHHSVNGAEMNVGAIGTVDANDRPGSSAWNGSGRAGGYNFSWGNGGAYSSAADTPPFLTVNFFIKL